MKIINLAAIKREYYNRLYRYYDEQIDCYFEDLKSMLAAGIQINIKNYCSWVADLMEDNAGLINGCIDLDY